MRRRHLTILTTALLLVAGVLSMPTPAGGVAGFGDVAEGQFYTAPVQWMVDNEITTGTSPTCFSPADPVTRGQAAAFMWRMEGSPTGSPPHPFTDVSASWQQEPVSWMAHTEITTGTTPTTYSPEDPVTRGQVAALLHRLAGSPDAPPSPFTDVTTPWQITPVGWMVQQKITTGTTATTFSPERTITRGEIATFFYRYKGSPAVAIDPTHPVTPPCKDQVSGPLAGTLRVLLHDSPPLVEFMNAFNAKFKEANPAVTIDMSVVAPGDVANSIQTRLAARDVDVVDYCAPPCAGFSNAVQPYMSGVGPPLWQQLIEAGLILDITNEPFVQNFDPVSIRDAATFNSRVYAINMGRIAYGGMFVNNDLLASVGVALPTTWSQLVAACATVEASGDECMTVGGGDTWPVYVGSYGLLGALYPDQAALVEGLWKTTVKWNDSKGLELFDRYHTYATEMLAPGVTGLTHDGATGRFAAGDVAFMPTGSWQAPVLESFGPGFDWTYVPFPGSDIAADNQYLFGKYDFNFMIAANTPHPDLAKAYLAGLSDPATYRAFVNETGFLPTQPTATLESTLGRAVAPLLSNFRVGYEQYWVGPSGAGQWANASQAASWFAPFNVWTDPVALANRAQADLEAGLPSP